MLASDVFCQFWYLVSVDLICLACIYVVLQFVIIISLFSSSSFLLGLFYPSLLFFSSPPLFVFGLSCVVLCKMNVVKEILPFFKVLMIFYSIISIHISISIMSILFLCTIIIVIVLLINIYLMLHVLFNILKMNLFF